MSFHHGLFGDASLFRKTLRHTIDEEQAARYAAVDQERRAYRHRASIELAVAMIEQALPLTDEQRRTFVDLVARWLNEVGVPAGELRDRA